MCALSARKNVQAGAVSKLVFYAQSTGAVISGRYTSHIVYLIFNNVYVLKWVYIQFWGSEGVKQTAGLDRYHCV